MQRYATTRRNATKPITANAASRNTIVVTRLVSFATAMSVVAVRLSGARINWKRSPPSVPNTEKWIDSRSRGSVYLNHGVKPARAVARERAASD